MIYGFIVLAVLFLDRISKIFALEHLMNVDTIPLIQDVFHLTYAENFGGAFSLLNGNVVFLIIVTSLMIGGLVLFLVKSYKNNENKLLLISLSMIIGGALGNIYDRITYGFVIDYFDFRLINFAIFNVADSFIVCGVILFYFHMFPIFNKDKKHS